MCHHKQRRVASLTGETYDGKTTRLEGENHACRSFPWWILWLIWPVVGLLKSAGAIFLNTWNTLGSFAIPANLLLALVLIVLGVLILLRSQQRD